MNSFEIVFSIFYYSGLFPFYYDRAAFSFSLSKFGQILKLIWALTLLLSLFWHLRNFLYERIQAEVYSDNIKYDDFLHTEWNMFLKHWTLLETIFALYCIYFVSAKKNVQFLKRYLVSSFRHLRKPKLSSVFTLIYACELSYELLLYFCYNLVMIK